MKTETQNQTNNSATTASAPAPKRRRMRRSRCTPTPNLNLSSSSAISASSASSALKQNPSNEAHETCTQSDHNSRSERLSSGTTLVAGVGSQIKNQKSEIPVPNPVHPVNPVQESSSRRHRAQPFQPLPEFAHLRPDQLEYIHDLLRDSTLADVQQQLHMDLGVRLSSSTLHRYRAQLRLADQLHLGTDTASAVDQLRDLYAARETDLDAAGLQVIKQRALALASAPKTSPTLLKDLHRIFTYEDRKQEKQLAEQRRHENRLELAHLREQTRLQISADRRATAAQTLAHRKDIDSQKLQLARERHALELRKQEHREKIDAAKAPNNHANANDEAAMRAEALLEYGRQLRRQREAQSSNGGTTRARSAEQLPVLESGSPTSISRDAITPPSAQVGAVVLNGPRSRDAVTSPDAAPADLKSEPMSQTTGTLTTDQQPN